MSKEIIATIIILAITTALIVGILSIYTNNEIQRLDEEIKKIKVNEVIALSSRFTLRLQYATGIMELMAQSHHMTEPPTDAGLISDQIKGIPEDADPEKRRIAREMLEKEFDFDYVFFSMPDGRIYFLEPFQSQLKLSQLNFAFRDWYQGAMNAESTYISEVYVSANERHNVIAIAVPVRDDAGQSLNGILVGALNLGSVQRSLEQINVGENEYFLIVDHKGNIVVDSRKAESDVEIRRFALDLSRVHQGGVSILTKQIDGTDHTVAFRTIPVGTHEWTVVSIQPHGDAFASSIALKNEAIAIFVAITTITAVTGFFMIRKINTNIKLSDRLKQINADLELKTEQIKKIDAQKEEFSAMITHELKTPLVPIIGYCKMLKNKMLGDLNDDQMESVDTIQSNAKRLENLISDIMDARKLDLDKMRFDMEEVSVDEIFGGLNASYKILQEGGNEFIAKASTPGLTVKTDKKRLRQVFDNLISNAIKFTPEKAGTIEVGAKKDGGSITFHVKDNGIGIPADKQANLFKKFYQVDTSERRKAGGTGLGLAISKGILEKMGGRIWVESDGKSGSTFYFTLPV